MSLLEKSSLLSTQIHIINLNSMVNNSREKALLSFFVSHFDKRVE